MMVCRNCGRPKGTPKSWRPDDLEEGWRACNKCVYIDQPTVSAADTSATSTPPNAPDPAPIDLKAALAALIAEVDPETAAIVPEEQPAPVSEPASGSEPTSSEPKVGTLAWAREVYHESTFTDLTKPEDRAAFAERAQEVAAQPPFTAAKMTADPPNGIVPRTGAGLGPTLPEHSPLGGSAAKRYLSCSGSVALMGQLRGNGDGQDEQEEWTAEGRLGHLLGEHCLENGHDACIYVGGRDRWEAVNQDLASAVQEYVDYVQSRPGQMLLEFKAHRPELHPWMYGAVDCVKYGVNDPFLEIIDLKLGAGVIVDVEENDQLRYYACLYIMADPAEWPDETPVHLTIVQPRAFHSGGKIRTWMTTVGDLKRWLWEVLLPGMQRTATIQGLFLDMGDHCQFCPAKIVCPAMGNLVRKAVLDATLHVTGSEDKPITTPGWKPVITGDEMKLLKMLISAYGKWSFAQLNRGADPEFVGMKLVFGKTNRVWKAGAEEALKALGEAAYTTPELKSPKQIEDLPGGAAIVAEYAYTPEPGLTLAPLSDKRKSANRNEEITKIVGHHMQKALAQGV